MKQAPRRRSEASVASEVRCATGPVQAKRAVPKQFGNPQVSRGEPGAEASHSYPRSTHVTPTQGGAAYGNLRASETMTEAPSNASPYLPIPSCHHSGRRPTPPPCASGVAWACRSTDLDDLRQDLLLDLIRRLPAFDPAPRQHRRLRQHRFAQPGLPRRRARHSRAPRGTAGPYSRSTCPAATARPSAISSARTAAPST